MDDIKCPKGEMVWVRFCSGNGATKFMLTSKITSRDFYYLYEVVDGKLRKLGRGKNPLELEEKFGVDNKVK
jgi:hypothetical protein